MIAQRHERHCIWAQRNPKYITRRKVLRCCIPKIINLKIAITGDVKTRQLNNSKKMREQTTNRSKHVNITDTVEVTEAKRERSALWNQWLCLTKSTDHHGTTYAIVPSYFLTNFISSPLTSSSPHNGYLNIASTNYKAYLLTFFHCPQKQEKSAITLASTWH